MILFILIFAFFFIVSTCLVVDILMPVKRTYKIVWGYGCSSEFELVEATSAAKAMKKFRKTHCLATVYGIKEVW